jgi:hypothetical protein
MLKTLSLVLTIVIVLSSSVVSAGDKVVAIPFNSAKKLKNVVTVSATGGDFTDPVAAINSITDASAGNPYLLVIGPGVYTLTQTLVMKPFITIAGSGKNATTLTGAISDPSSPTNSAIVVGSNNATLRDLTVTNTGGSKYSLAVSATSHQSLDIKNVIVNVSGGANNYGMNIVDSSPAITNVTINVSGGTENIGMYLMYYSSPTISNVTTNVAGGTGISIYVADLVVIQHSRIYGSIDGIHTFSGTTRVTHSSIVGGATESGGTLTCVNSDNGVATALSGTCQ